MRERQENKNQLEKKLSFRKTWEDNNVFKFLAN